jgi:glycine/D-amino acid oxidase-like deaminating enzyme
MSAPIIGSAVSPSGLTAVQANSTKPKHIIVIGAGAFGGWSALNLLRKGARVTLIDAIEAGNPLASSGGETRVIRHAYEQRIYVDLVVRALEMWKENDRRWGTRLFNQKGVLFMGQEREFIDAAMTHMEAAGVNIEILQGADIAQRYQQLNPENLKWAVYEPDAGYLTARLACIAVRDAFIEEGGEYRLARVAPGAISAGEMAGVLLEDGSRLQADQYVFACGPWLKELFPEVFADLIKVTRQELYFFKPPAEHSKAFNQDLPVWAEVGTPFFYGIPGNGGVFKIGDDTRGPEVDPTTQSRSPTQTGIDKARAFMEYRFPAMKNASLVDARVCQYSETKDYNFIIDRHPQAQNTWLAGGGSGHGFKHSPALGEMIADQVLGNRPSEEKFTLSRFS